jgi:hypothetical protein
MEILFRRRFSVEVMRGDRLCEHEVNPGLKILLNLGYSGMGLALDKERQKQGWAELSVQSD